MPKSSRRRSQAKVKWETWAEASPMSIEQAIKAAEVLGQSGDPRFAEGADNWVTIEAGDFLMGAQNKDPSQPNWQEQTKEAESPVHKVYLSA